MAVIEWRDSFRTGIRSVDHEHQELIESINRLADRLLAGCTANEVSAALGDMHALIEAHFALEEKVMRNLAYAGYPAHKADHDRLLDEIREIMDDVEAGGPQVRAALAGRLELWFGRHFASFDRDFHVANRRNSLKIPS